MSEENRAPRHWASMAEVWKQVGPPLRPSTEDQRSYWRSIEGLDF